MTDALQEFVAEAKKNKYSAIPKLSDDGKLQCTLS